MLYLDHYLLIIMFTFELHYPFLFGIDTDRKIKVLSPVYVRSKCDQIALHIVISDTKQKQQQKGTYKTAIGKDSYIISSWFFDLL